MPGQCLGAGSGLPPGPGDVTSRLSLPTDQSRSSQEADRPSIQPALLGGRAARANACWAGDTFQGLGAPASGPLAASSPAVIAIGGAGKPRSYTKKPAICGRFLSQSRKLRHFNGKVPQPSAKVAGPLHSSGSPTSGGTKEETRAEDRRRGQAMRGTHRSARRALGDASRAEPLPVRPRLIETQKTGLLRA